VTAVPVIGAMSESLRSSKIRGVHTGIVVDNKDGDGNPGYRVKLKLPWLNEQETTFWARVAVPMGGPGRGTYTLPEIDDQVLVVFEHGDIHRPIVIGALWSKKQEPVEVNESGNNNTKLIKSRCGHRIIFDDKEGAEKITIVDKTKNNKIVLDSVNKIVKIESAGDIEVIAKTNVIMHANALKIGSSEGVTGKGRSLLTHAAKTFGLKATTTITIGGGNTTINVSNAAATSVSGSGSGELGGGPPAAALPQIDDNATGPRKSGGARAASSPTADDVIGDSLPLSPPLPPTSPTPPGEDVPLTTLEVVVVDNDNKPLSSVRFEVKDPSGKVHQGTTNPEGLIRIDGLPAGQCEVSLTDLAPDDWKLP
jgi:phage baseplate assembly protein gpV